MAARREFAATQDRAARDEAPAIAEAREAVQLDLLRIETSTCWARPGDMRSPRQKAEPRSATHRPFGAVLKAGEAVSSTL